MNPRDWTLMVIASSDGREVTPVQLQKALFLIGENLSSRRLQVKRFYRFVPYDYGPFCPDVYRDADALVADGLARLSPPTVGNYRQYAATAEGRSLAEQLADDLDAETRNYLQEVVAWVQSLSFAELVRAIYKKYPKMKVRSVFRDS